MPSQTMPNVVPLFDLCASCSPHSISVICLSLLQRRQNHPIASSASCGFASHSLSLFRCCPCVTPLTLTGLIACQTGQFCVSHTTSRRHDRHCILPGQAPVTVLLGWVREQACSRQLPSADNVFICQL
ncbi:hypothetical protein BCR44DRAFT_1449950 [Catenaria anguillulae PL171]|uniref:Uncharacterized protein n=1 Tax=Catenaria anguillulae PL171 TaxID=765915 RepID=A0A1Y2H4I6_9FUNG|nr:hypothetical protein BCR44DRAFT_1449950 [Catenaria anguillulae PL171]